MAFEIAYGVSIIAADKASGVARGIGQAFDRLGSTVDRASKRAAKALRRDFGGAVSSLAKGLKGLGAAAAAGIGAITAALTALTAVSGRAAAEQQVLADRLGTSIGFLSGVADAAGSRGVATDLEELGAVMGDLAARARTDAKLFEEYGISVSDGAGGVADSETILKRTADRLAEMASQTQRLALADELAGEGGRKLLTVIQDGSAALDAQITAAAAAGATLTEYDGKASKALVGTMNQAINRLSVLGQVLSGQLAPLLTAVFQVLGQVAGATTAWIRANGDLIGSGIQELLAWMADSAIPAIATGVSVVVQGFTGLRQVVTLLQKIGTEAFQGMLEGLSSLMRGLAAAARFTGQDGLAGQLESLADTQSFVAQSLNADIASYTQEILRTEQAQRDLEARIGSFGTSASTAVRTVARRTAELTEEFKRTGEQATKTGEIVLKSLEEIEAAKAAAAAAERRRAAEAKERHDKAVQAAKDAARERQRAQDEEAAAMQRRISDLQSTSTEIFGSIADAGVSAFSDIGEEVDGRTKTMGDAFAQFFGSIGKMLAEYMVQFLVAKATEAAAEKSAATVKVTAKAASAAAGAAESQSSIPYVGPILAVAAMAAILAAVLGLLGGFNTGGLVPGTGPNVDSRIARVTPGELVLDREATGMLLRSMMGRGGSGAAPAARGATSASSSARAMGGGGSGPSVVIQAMVPPANSTEVRRTYDLIKRETAEMERRGQLRPSRQRLL